ncbi:hypothetical protein AUP07_0293 [methanogenic archaeon mixed culture ISO4-G1]|jgi:hypothetical protein|nr:hypothetical protein AUP07_0293 [methanogenic archaeon mixed culture ISO4-G1]
MDYDIKKGWFKNIEGDLLAQLMGEVFGNVKREGDKCISSYGVLDVIEVTVLSKDKLDITTKNREGPMTDEQILDSKRKLNIFAEKATGFDAKARMKRAQKKAKEGTL